jgi:hypothetical protein
MSGVQRGVKAARMRCRAAWPRTQRERGSIAENVAWDAGVYSAAAVR